MIFFLFPSGQNQPAGGAQSLCDYIFRLNELSKKEVACLLTDSEFIFSWLPDKYKSIRIMPTYTKVGKHDTVVIPEVMPEKIFDYHHAKKKVLAVLNWKYYETFMKDDDPKKMGYDFILTNSNFSKNFLTKKKKVSIPVYHIPHVIDTEFHAPRVPLLERIDNSILVFNRKNVHHLPPLVDFLRTRPHQLSLVNFLHPVQLAELYNRHQVFINLGYPEGFCRPAAEAMASGCIVVGFTGGGGSDFMVDGENAFLAEDGDMETVYKKLEYVLFEMKSSEKLKMVKKARETIVKKYDKLGQAKVIYEIFAKDIEEKYTAKELEKAYKESKKAVAEVTQVPAEKDVLLDQMNDMKNYYQKLAFQYTRISQELQAKLSDTERQRSALDTHVGELRERIAFYDHQAQSHHSQITELNAKLRELTASKYFLLWKAYAALKYRVLPGNRVDAKKKKSSAE